METLPNTQKRNELVNLWLNNLKKGVRNQVILLIIVKEKIDEKFQDKIRNSIEKILCKNNEKKLEFNIFKLDESLTKNFDFSDNEKNTILLANSIFSTIAIKKIKKEILCISLDEPIDMLFKENNHNNIDFKDTSNIPFLLYKKDPLKILELDASTIGLFIYHFVIHDRQIKSMLYHGTNINYPIRDLIDGNIHIQNIHKEYLKKDIMLLKEKAILTSRLAIIIYRNAKLDFNANLTEIGRYYSRIFSKSKVVNLKKISQDTSVNYNGLSKTIVKAYNLNNKLKTEEEEIKKALEAEIKKRIVKKIFCYTDLDIDKIQKIVELPKDTLIGYKREVESEAL